VASLAGDEAQPKPLDNRQLDAMTGLAVGILVDLVRIDTSNPPGNEIVAARYLRDRLAAEGIDGTIVEPEATRGNVIARLDAPRAGRTGKGLLLLSHLDVVPAEPEHWDVAPFSGEIRDGVLWGRGTVDTKGLTAAEAAIMITVKRLGMTLRRDLVLAATAGEETGGGPGVRWLAENRLDLLEADAALNEGGGMGLELGKKRAYLVQTAEKLPCPVRITATGKPGHASIPAEDNAIVHLSRALVAIGSRQLPVHLTETFNRFVETLAGQEGLIPPALVRSLLAPGLVEEAMSRLVTDPVKRAGLSAMIRNTATPTIVKAGYKVNVIPGEASAELDCRLLPGFCSKELIDELQAVLAGTGLADKIRLQAPDTVAAKVESPAQGELYDLMASATARHAAGAPLLPFLMPGATDGRFLRPRGIPVYGFSPMLPNEPVGTAHGHNERISLASIRFELQILWDVITGYCAV
jgi:acetylornithine deacetylase/succinyl-diaminopimelate desuccinylase-like protein